MRRRSLLGGALALAASLALPAAAAVPVRLRSDMLAFWRALEDLPPLDDVESLAAAVRVEIARHLGSLPVRIVQPGDDAFVDLVSFDGVTLESWLGLGTFAAVASFGCEFHGLSDPAQDGPDTHDAPLCRVEG
jgi:hypothetical protein